MRIISTALVQSLFLSSYAYADFDQSTLFDVCKAVYSDGSRDIYSFATDTERARNYFNAICKIRASSYDEFNKEAKDLNTSGDMVYGLFKLQAHGDRDWGQFKSELDSNCSKLSDDSYLRSLVSEHSPTINH